MKGGRIGVRVLIGVILLWTVVPLVWMVLSSLKPADELTSNPPTLAFKPTFQHYSDLFGGANDIGAYALNSIIAAGVSTLIAVGLGCLAGYGLARSQFRGKDHVSFWIISTRMAPIAAVVLPLFTVVFGGCCLVTAVLVWRFTGRREPRVAALLTAFERRTGLPCLVNTSLNTAGRPMVDTPREALELFGSAPVDLLALGPISKALENK